MIILGMMAKQTGSYKHRKNKSNRKRPVRPTAVEKHDGQTEDFTRPVGPHHSREDDHLEHESQTNRMLKAQKEQVKKMKTDLRYLPK